MPISRTTLQILVNFLVDHGMADPDPHDRLRPTRLDEITPAIVGDSDLTPQEFAAVIAAAIADRTSRRRGKQRGVFAARSDLVYDAYVVLTDLEVLAGNIDLDLDSFLADARSGQTFRVRPTALLTDGDEIYYCGDSTFWIRRAGSETSVPGIGTQSGLDTPRLVEKPGA